MVGLNNAKTSEQSFRTQIITLCSSLRLEQLSPSLEEASAVFGASPLRTLTRITLPLITANLIGGGLLCIR